MTRLLRNMFKFRFPKNWFTRQSKHEHNLIIGKEILDNLMQVFRILFRSSDSLPSKRFVGFWAAFFAVDRTETCDESEANTFFPRGQTVMVESSLEMTVLYMETVHDLKGRERAVSIKD